MTPNDYQEMVPAGLALRRVETPAGRIAAWERPGIGRPLVMIHGNTSSKCVFRHLLAQPVLQSRRLLALDLPGAGQSDDARDPATFYTFTGLALTILAALAALDVQSPVVLGWSLGGHLAIEAVGQGADFAGMILTGTPPCGPGVDEITAVFNTSDLMPVGMTETPEADMLSAYIKALYGSNGPVDPELIAAGLRFDGRLRGTMSANMLSDAAPRPHPQRAVIAQWPGPIAMIQGDEEPFFDPRGPDNLEWVNLWRHAGQMVPGCGHAPFYQRPDLYAALVTTFLKDIGV